MARDDQEELEDWAVEIDDPEPREDGQPGPPDDWPYPSWYDRKENDWWWMGRPDPSPVRPLGYSGGNYIFVTAAHERRSFTASQLFGRGGLADLFAGSLWWPDRHFRKYDKEAGKHVGPFNLRRCMAALIRACKRAGFYDGAIPHRSVGTWRGPGGAPVVHAGDRIFAGGRILPPGSILGEVLYVIGGSRQAPAYANVGRDQYEWLPCGSDVGHLVAAHLDEWHWQDLEARDLFLGGLFCDMLGDAPRWKPHKFVRAPAGSGKSTLLQYVRALLGGSAHRVERTYSKARLEDHHSHTSCALLLDESESDTEAERVRKIFDLVLLLSDTGAVGGRYKRDIDLHGTVTMVATLTEEWRGTIRSRVAYLELRSLRDRLDHPPLPPVSVEAMIAKAVDLSPGLRARAIARYDLFQENVERVRVRILALGGTPRDADQLGHLIAGWATMTSDAPLDDDDLARLARFAPYIMTLVDEEDGTDEAADILNVLYGLPVHSYRGGDQLTVGQLIARARLPDNYDMRRALLALGLRLQRVGDETWEQAWLAIANKHPGLDKLLADYPQFVGPKRAQILGSLRREVNGEVFEAKPSAAPIRFAGPQARALLIPPFFLPTLREEKEATGEAWSRHDVEPVS